MSGAATVRIALVDDHMYIIEGMALVIEALGGYSVTMTALNGQELIARYADAEPPDIAIVDMHMPVMGGAATIQWIRQRWPATLVLGLSFHRTPAVLKEAMRAGACGFIPKDLGRMETRDALEGVLQRGYYHHDPLIREHLATGDSGPEVDLTAKLTHTQNQVLDCVCVVDEPTWDQVADRMGKTPATVDTHRADLFKKLHMKSKAGLVSFGREHGYGKGKYWSPG